MSTNTLTDGPIDKLHKIRDKYGSSQPRQNSTLSSLDVKKSIEVSRMPLRKSSMKGSEYYGAAKQLLKDYSNKGLKTTEACKYEQNINEYDRHSYDNKYDKHNTNEKYERFDRSGNYDKYDRYDRYDKHDKFDTYERKSENLCPITNIQVPKRISFGEEEYPSSHFVSEPPAAPKKQNQYSRKLDLEREISKIRQNYAANRRKILGDDYCKYPRENPSTYKDASLEKQLDEKKYQSSRQILQKKVKTETYLPQSAKTFINYKDYKDYKQYKDLQEDRSSPIKKIISDQLFRKNPNQSQREIYPSNNDSLDSPWCGIKLYECTNELNKQRFTGRQHNQTNSLKNSGIYKQSTALLPHTNTSYDSPMKKLSKKYDENSENIQNYGLSQKRYNVSNLDKIQQRIQKILG